MTALRRKGSAVNQKKPKFRNDVFRIVNQIMRKKEKYWMYRFFYIY